MPENSDEKQTNPVTFRKVFVTTTAALLRAGLLHPLDTAGKRLQFNADFAKDFNSFCKIVLGGAYQKSYSAQVQSMYQGIRWAFAHRVCQFNSLMILTPFIQNQYATLLGKKTATSDILGGCTAGFVEAIFFIKLDSEKVRWQTRLNGQQTLQFASSYKAFPITVFRNSLFLSTNSLIYAHLKSAAVNHGVLTEPKQEKGINIYEIFLKTLAATLATLGTNPVEVVKTRVQTLPANSPETAPSVTNKIFQQEGMRAFSKGMGPRSIASIGYAAFFGLEACINHIYDKIIQPRKSGPSI